VDLFELLSKSEAFNYDHLRLKFTPIYEFRVNQYFRNECDWDITESGYDKEKLIATVLTNHFKYGHIQISGNFTLSKYLEIDLPVEFDTEYYTSGGEFIFQTFRTTEPEVIEITHQEIKNHPVWQAINAQQQLEKSQSMLTVQKAVEQRELEIYLKVKKQLEDSGV